MILVGLKVYKLNLKAVVCVFMAQPLVLGCVELDLARPSSDMSIVEAAPSPSNAYTNPVRSVVGLVTLEWLRDHRP